MSELRDGLQEELARVQRDIERHYDKAFVIDAYQWWAQLKRLRRSQADLLDRIREAA